MGVCTKGGRITICHINKVNMLNRFTKIVGDENMNVSDMIDKSRGEYAYTVMDLDTPVTPEVVEKLQKVDGVIRVRVIK